MILGLSLPGAEAPGSMPPPLRGSSTLQAPSSLYFMTLMEYGCHPPAYGWQPRRAARRTGPYSSPWLDVICQRTASASWGGSWRKRLEAYWYTEGSAGALGPGRTGQPG